MFLEIIKIVFLYIIILFGSMFISDIFNKKIDKTFIIYLLSVSALMYVFSIINCMKFGVYFICTISIILGFYTIIKNIRKKQLWPFLKNNIFTFGLLFFTVIFIVLMIISYNKILPDWDNFSYWSYYDKYVYYNNTLAIEKEYAINVYPPFPTILEYFVMNIFGEYRQGLEAFIVELICFTFFIPVFSKIKEVFGKIITAIAIFIFPTIFLTLLFWLSAYPDFFLGLLFGFMCYIYIKEKDKKFLFFELVLGIILLTITKPIGVFLGVIFIAIIIIFELLKKISNKEMKRFLFSKELIRIYILIFGLITILVSFKIYTGLNISEVQNYNKPKYEVSSAEYIINSFKAFITGEGTEEEINGAISICSLIPTIYNYPIIYSPFKITIFWAIVIATILGVINYFIFRNKDNKKSKFLFMLFCIILGFVGYMFFLQLAYLANFSMDEMIHHNGIDRYASTYIVTIFYFVFVMVVDFISLKKIKFIKNKILYKIIKDICYLFVFTFVMILVSSNYFLNIIFNFERINELQVKKFEYSNEIVEYFNNFNLSSDDKILMLSQDRDKRLDILMARYTLFPTKMFIIEPFTENGDNEITNFENIIKDFDYIYIYNFDDVFKKNTENYFEFGSIVEEKTLYKINDNFKLEKIIK